MLSCKKQDAITERTQIHSIYTGVPRIYDTIINPHLLQDYIFNKGTFWIYKDSITDILDTCLVDSVVIDYKDELCSAGFFHIKFAFNIKQSTFPCSYALSSNGIYLYSEDGFYYNFYFDSVHNNGDFYLNNKDTLYNSYLIDTSTYTSVYKIFYKKPSSYYWPSFPDSGYYYMKVGIGIIKSEYYFNGQRSVYELMQYHIN
jgi:hypothetical protein